MNKTFFWFTLIVLIITGCDSKGNNAKTSKNMKHHDEALSLRIVRQLDVAPDVVFEAFTEPNSMRVWWTKTTTFDIDLRVGGRWTITRTEGKTVYTATGEYLAIDRPKQLIYTYGMPQFSPNSDVITIDIDSDGDIGSIVTFVVAGKDIASELSALPQGSTSHSEQGWQMAFDLMASAWKKSKS